MKMKLSLLAASAILAVGMTGCWTENEPTPVEETIVAKALDGYVLGGDGCFDTNDNGSCSDETSTFKTNSVDGSYYVSRVNTRYKVVITGGTDKDTGKAFTGVLKAPAGSRVATPLTTLLADGMSEDQITDMLGLPRGTDLSVDYRKEGSFNAEVTKAAMIVEAITGQLTAIFSADPSLSKADIMTKIVAAMKNENLTLADLSNPAKLTTLIQAVDTSLNSSVDTTNVATIVTNLAATVTTVKDATITENTAASVTQTVSNATTANVANVAITKAVTIANNNVTVGGTSTSFTQAGAFTPVTVSSASNVTIDFTLENNGGELSTTAKTMDLAILVDDVNSGRELKGVLKGVQVTVNGTTSTITVPANAVLYVEGKKSTGVGVTTELTDMAQDVFTSNNGVTSVNLTNIMNRIGAKDPASFATITKEGTYNISFFIGGNVTLGFDGASVKVLTAPIETLTVTTTPSHTESVTGTKFTATLTVTK